MVSTGLYTISYGTITSALVKRTRQRFVYYTSSFVLSFRAPTSNDYESNFLTHAQDSASCVICISYMYLLPTLLYHPHPYDSPMRLDKYDGPYSYLSLPEHYI